MRKTRLYTVSNTSLYGTSLGGSGVISLSHIRKNEPASSFYRCFHITEKLYLSCYCYRGKFHAVEKNKSVKKLIFMITVYLDIAEDYSSQNRYRFRHGPHL